jgi:radical SAM protein with 4Fe4S-binding SPASM domain
MIDCFATRNSFQVDAQGKVSPCCKFKGNYSHIDEYQTVVDIFSDPRLSALREDHTQGVWTKSCVRCEQDEASKKQSRKQMYEVIGLGTGDFFIDVSLGNYCNLKCRMCSPENSSQWGSDYNALIAEGLVSAFKYTNYLMSEHTIEMIASFIDTVNGRIVIEVKGGEPLLMPNSQSFFVRLSECVNSNNIEIWIASNGTKIPDWFSDCIKRFKKVELSISVDGSGKVYNYIRGSKHSYDDILLNATTLSNIENVMLRFNVVVQNLNIKNVADLYDDLFGIVKSHNKITLIVLRFPEYYQSNIYPDSKKQSIYDSWDDRVIQCNPSYNAMANVFLMPNNEGYWNTFQKITEVLDSRRKQDIAEVDTCLKT